MKEPTPPPNCCPACYGKGYATRCFDEMGSDDFGGEGYIKRGQIEKVPCRKCQGAPAKVELASGKDSLSSHHGGTSPIDKANLSPDVQTPDPVPEGEMEKIIDDIHEMVNQYGGEGSFEDWCKLRAFIRKLQVKKIRSKKIVNLDDCNNFFDAIIAVFRDYESRNAVLEKEKSVLRKALDESQTALFMHDQYQSIYRRNKEVIASLSNPCK